MSNVTRCFMLAASIACGTFCPTTLRSQDVKYDSDSISGLGARNIGSATMSGRIAALTAVKEEGRLTVYVGAASGGVWKSVNGGTTYKRCLTSKRRSPSVRLPWIPRTPKRFGRAPVNPGPATAFSIGDGIYKSTDGGENWTNMGLKESSIFSKI